MRRYINVVLLMEGKHTAQMLYPRLPRAASDASCSPLFPRCFAVLCRVRPRANLCTVHDRSLCTLRSPGSLIGSCTPPAVSVLLL